MDRLKNSISAIGGYLQDMFVINPDDDQKQGAS